MPMPRLEPHFDSPIRRAAERGKTKNLRVLFVRQIVDSTEDLQVWVHFVFGRDVYEGVVFYIKIRSAEI